MPAANPYVITSAIVAAFEQSGADATIQLWGKQPRALKVETADGEQICVHAYAWTVTGGGKGRKTKDEYRIQVTKSLEQNPDGPTVLLGYDPDSGMFCGFDLGRRSNANSPSVQLKGAVFDRARQDGMAIHERDTGELVIAMRPDRVLEYVLYSRDFHNGRRAIEVVDAPLLSDDDGSLTTLEDLARVRKDIEEDAYCKKAASRLCKPFSGRKKRLTHTSIRDREFQRIVLSLDGRECVLCGKGFRTSSKGRPGYVNLQAAHIRAVAEGGTDHPRNGLAQCPEHHDLFDKGFWTLSDDLAVIVLHNANVDKAREAFRELAELLQYEGKTICGHREHYFKPNVDDVRHHRKRAKDKMEQMYIRLKPKDG